MIDDRNICRHCGYDARTGKKRLAKIEKLEAELSVLKKGEDYTDMLERLESKGVLIPIREWTQAENGDADKRKH